MQVFEGPQGVPTFQDQVPTLECQRKNARMQTHPATARGPLRLYERKVVAALGMKHNK